MFRFITHLWFQNTWNKSSETDYNRPINSTPMKFLTQCRLNAAKKCHRIGFSFEGGRSWCTALGHMKETYATTNFRNHLRGGLLYALGMPTGAVHTPIQSKHFLINGKLIFHSK